MTHFIEHFRSWGSAKTAGLAILLCIVGVLTRIPFRAQILHHWDSINFALAMEHFDVRLHQPHPPGTFVIYIMLGRLFNVFLHDPNASLVWLSVVLSGLGIAVLFLLSEEMFDRRVSLTTALLAIVSPLVWFHGEVALSYMLEFLWVPLIVYSCYKMQTNSWWALLASALLIGMAGGVRPNTPVFLFPLWGMGVIAHKYPFKKILAALLVMAFGVLVWAVPMIAMSGGLKEYIGVMQWWQEQHMEESASLVGIAENVSRLGMYTVYAIGLGGVPLVVATSRSLRNIIRTLKKDWRAQTLAGWILPGVGYFAIIHLRQPGHTFTIQPSLFLLTGLAIVFCACRKGIFHRRVWIGVMVVVVITNALFFLIGPTYLFGDTRMLFTTPTWNAIHDYDVYVTDRLNVIRETFSPHETAVVASGRNFRLPDFYLPDFQLSSLSHMINSSSMTLTEPINTLVIFDDSVLPGLPTNIVVQSVPLPDGGLLRYITWEETQIVELGGDWLDIRDR